MGHVDIFDVSWRSMKIWSPFSYYKKWAERDRASDLCLLDDNLKTVPLDMNGRRISGILRLDFQTGTDVHFVMVWGIMLYLYMVPITVKSQNFGGIFLWAKEEGEAFISPLFIISARELDCD